MPNDEGPASPRPVFFTNEFKRNVRQLARKYRRIKTDLQPLMTELEAGSTPGDRIPGVAVEVYKVRIRNSDSARGKRGGYRLLYQVTPAKTIILVTLYAKTEQADIALHEIQAIIATYQDAQEAPAGQDIDNAQPATEQPAEPGDPAHEEREPNTADPYSEDAAYGDR